MWGTPMFCIFLVLISLSCNSCFCLPSLTLFYSSDLLQFFPYILLLVAILMYIPALFWRFTAAPHLSSDLNFIMEELDRSYNRAIRLAKSLASSIDTKDVSDDPPR